MARYFFQDEDAAKFEANDKVLVLSAKRALTLGGCSTAGYLLELLVESPTGALLTIEVFVKSQNSANHYLQNPLGWFVFNTIRVGDDVRLWHQSEYAIVKEIAA